LRKDKKSGFNSYFFVILLLLLAVWSISLFNDREAENYSRTQLVKDIESGNISSLTIYPNREAPTGYLDVRMKNGTVKKLYATDITELESLIRGYNIDPKIENVERESWVLTTLVPLVLCLGAGLILFMMIIYLKRLIVV